MTVLVWVPDVRRDAVGSDGGSFTSPVRKWLWHTVEGATMAGALATYAQTGNRPHITWHPGTGEMVQHIPFTRAARALKNEPGGVQTNRDGVIQVEVIGFAAHPFTDGPMVGLDVLRQTWRALGIPEVFPAGPPLPYPKSYGANGQRSTATWVMPGHFCHSQVPENVHGDPGAIDPARLFPPPPKAPVVIAPPHPTPQEDDDMTPEQDQRLRNAEQTAGEALAMTHAIGEVVARIETMVEQIAADLARRPQG